MRFSFHFRSKVSVVFSLVALASIIGGFLFFLGVGHPVGTVEAKGLAYSDLSKIQKRLLSGFVSSELDSSQATVHRTNAAARSSYFPTSDDGCPQNRGDNVKVNQNCLNITDTTLARTRASTK